MVNEINKMDKSPLPVAGVTFDKNLAKPNDKQAAKAASSDESVEVSSHLTQLASLLDAEENVPSQSAVADVKQRIQSGEYSIDYNVLSAKLLNSGVLSGS